MKRISLWDAYISVLLLFISGAGVFYSAIRLEGTVHNVYGDSVRLFGRGIYAYESQFKGPIFVGTDVVILVLVVVFLVLMSTAASSQVRASLRIGFYTVFLYYTASLSLGTMMNPLFIVYAAACGVLFYRLIFDLAAFDYAPSEQALMERNLPKGLPVFLVVMGLSTFVWFFEIVTLATEGRPSHLIGMQSTEPTYLFDLAVIAPACFIAAYMVKKKQAKGLILAVMMCLLMASIGLIVTSQTITQRMFGVEITLFEMLVFVVTFMVLSTVAFVYLFYTLKAIKQQESLMNISDQ